MEERVLINFLIDGESCDQIAKLHSITTNKVNMILRKYYVNTYSKELYKENFRNIDAKKTDIKGLLAGKGKSVIVHHRVLLLFLVHGYSKRGICRMIPEIKDSRGKK